VWITRPARRGTASEATDAHLGNLERDWVTRDGEKGRADSTFENKADGRALIEHGDEGATSSASSSRRMLPNG
jgi:hypothetical protein